MFRFFNLDNDSLTYILDDDDNDDDDTYDEDDKEHDDNDNDNEDSDGVGVTDDGNWLYWNMKYHCCLHKSCWFVVLSKTLHLL